MNDKERLEAIGVKDTDLNTNDFLKHHGILGMKWGIRRFQPYSKGEGHKGRYTGKKNNIERLKTNKSKKKEAKEKKKELKKNPVSPAKSMSDDELRQALNRINMEKQYDQLTTAEKTKGRKLYDELVVKSMKVAVAGTVVRLTTDQINKILKGK